MANGNANGLPAEWAQILGQCAAIPPESGAWDSLDGFIDALKATAEEKAAQRQAQQRLDQFLSEWSAWLEHGDLPEECRAWTARNVPGDKAPAVVAALGETDALVREAEAINQKVAAAQGVKQRIEHLEQLEKLTDQIVAMCNKLTPVLKGDGQPAGAGAAGGGAQGGAAGLDALDDHSWNE